MNQNIYFVTSNMFIKSIDSLISILQKIQEEANSKSDPEEKILNDRLAEDMLPLTKQVQMVSDSAKNYVGRVTEIKAPLMEDTEKSINELIERLEKTKTFLSSVSESDFTNSDQSKVVLPTIPGKFQTAYDYTKDYAIPNFFFHLVTSYAILRKRGYSLGKMDYINSLNLQDL